METLLHLTSDTLDIYAAITFMSVLLKKKVRTPITIPFFIIYMVVLWLLEPVSSILLTTIISSVILFFLTFLYEGKMVIRVLSVLLLTLCNSLGETFFTIIARPYIPDLYTTDDYRIFLLMMLGSSICQYLNTRIIIVFWRITFHKARINYSLLTLLSPILSLFLINSLISS